MHLEQISNIRALSEYCSLEEFQVQIIYVFFSPGLLPLLFFRRSSSFGQSMMAGDFVWSPLPSLLPQHFLNTSLALPRHILGTSSALPQHFLSTSSALPWHFLGISSALPRHFLGTSSALSVSVLRTRRESQCLPYEVFHLQISL